MPKNSTWIFGQLGFSFDLGESVYFICPEACLLIFVSFELLHVLFESRFLSWAHWSCRALFKHALTGSNWVEVGAASGAQLVYMANVHG